MVNLIEPKTFNNQCAVVLAKYVDSQDELVWERNGLDKVTFTCKNKATPIISNGSFLLRLKNSGLMLHCNLTYIEPDPKASVERKFDFQRISLQFYHGADFCFCRAEWDLKDKPEKLDHPQPHWHWGKKKGYGAVDAFTADEESVFEVDDNHVDRGRKPDINFSELHYAMSAKWLEKGENSLAFSFPNLTKWMENALIMVIDQYNYQVSKKSFISVRRKSSFL